jgi:hypothetical protein
MRNKKNNLEEFMKRKLRYSILAALFYFAGSVQAISYTTLNYPGAKETYITDIEGDTIVGYYSYNLTYDIHGYPRVIDPHGFVYDGQTWATLDCPRRLESQLGGLRVHDTTIEGIDNGNIVGNCNIFPYRRQSGFIYDGQTWTLLDFPGSRETHVQGIDGSYIAGTYSDGTGYHGFVYDGTNWTTLLYPWIDGYTRVVGISGNNVAIYGYNHVNGWDGIIYNLESQSWNTIKFPGAKNTIVLGIDGSNIIGAYGEGEGFQQYFLYNGTSWTSFDRFISPRFGSDVINDIEGNIIVGYYTDSTGVHGFTATIPEPATLALLAFGGLILRRRKL